MALPELMPDRPDRNNPGLEIAKNCLPAVSGYQPFPDKVVNPAMSVIGLCMGGDMLIHKGGAVHKYIGTRNRIQTGDSYQILSNNSYNLPENGVWEFVNWGNAYIACNGVNPLQSGTLGTSESGNIAGAPEASTVAVVRDFVVAGQALNERNTVYWSAIGNPFEWTVGTQQAGLQALEGGGRIRKVVGGEYGVVFTDNAIWRMSYVGAPIVWQFDQVEQRRGCLNQNSVIAIGELIYFLSADGFYVFDGANARPIASQKIVATFMEDYNRGQFLIDQSRMSVAADNKNKRIYWFYESKDNPLIDIANRCMVFQWDTGRWTGPHDITCSHAIHDVKLDEIYLFDSNAYSLTGTPLTAELESGEYQLTKDGRTLVQGVRPVVDGDENIVPLVTVGSRDRTSGAVTWGNDLTPNPKTGFADMRRNARYFRWRLKVSGNFTDISGMEYRFGAAGRQ